MIVLSNHSGNLADRSSILLAAIWIGLLASANQARAEVAYLVDDGTAERSVIVLAGSEPRPTLWLNAFDTQPGGEVITSIAVTWGRTTGGSSGVPEHAPTTLLLYQDDPSNDRDPRTATLLVLQVLDHGAPLGSIDTGVFLDVPIPPTTVSGTFFVAALYPDPGEGFPAPVDTTDPDLSGTSWVFSAIENAVNVNDLGDPFNFGGLIEAPPFNLPGNWLLRATGTGATAVTDAHPGAAPRAFFLGQNRPNPFNPTTSIPYHIARAGAVRLAVYNAAGQLVRILLDRDALPGHHAIRWDGKSRSGREMPSGSYVYQLVADGHVSTRRMLLLR